MNGVSLTASFPGISKEEAQGDNQPLNLCSPVVFSDESRIMQVLLNLQSNALKFTKKGSVKIVVEIVVREDEERYLKVQVIDSGIGISEAN